MHLRSRADMYKNITPDYYGYRDDDDGVLKVKEAEMEVIIVQPPHYIVCCISA